MHGLSDTELCDLDNSLADESIESAPMDLAMLDGYLTAIAIGPGMIPPCTWLPWVWDHVDGRAEPVFDKNSHANHILSMLMRHYNVVVEAFDTDPAGFEAIFMRGLDYGAAEWADGFLCGCFRRARVEPARCWTTDLVRAIHAFGDRRRHCDHQETRQCFPMHRCHSAVVGRDRRLLEIISSDARPHADASNPDRPGDTEGQAQRSLPL